MSPLSHLCLLIVLTLYACLQTADSVKCANDSDCLQTDFTLPKCQDGVCECKAPYEPITSGCGKKIEKPTVSFYGAPSNMVWAYASLPFLLLICPATDLPYESMYTPEVRRIWKYGDEELEEDSGFLKINISDTTVASPYTCAITPGRDAPIGSEFSDTFKIILVKENTLPGGGWRPILDVQKKAMTGAKLPMNCINFPLYYTFNVEYYTTASSSPINHTSFIFKSDVELYCKATLLFVKMKPMESERVNVTLAENVAGVTISILGKNADTSSYDFETGDNATFKCQDDGDVAFNSRDVEFLWQMGSKTVRSQAGTYKVNFNETGSTTYKCLMKVGDQEPVESQNITVTVTTGEPFPGPVIEVTPKEATPQSHVSLACGKKDTTGKTTYRWHKDTLVILGQSDRVIQYQNIGVTPSTYACVASKDGYLIGSPDATIAAKPNKPTLTVTNSPKTYHKGDNYTLNCTTSPTSSYLVYYFSRNGEVFNLCYYSTLTLANVNSTDSGNYTCQVQVELMDIYSDVSNTVRISVEAPGKLCDTRNDCKGKEFSGSCAESRCVCQSGYKAVGGGCTII